MILYLVMQEKKNVKKRTAKLGIRINIRIKISKVLKIILTTYSHLICLEKLKHITYIMRKMKN